MRLKKTFYQETHLTCNPRLNHFHLHFETFIGKNAHQISKIYIKAIISLFLVFFSISN